MTKRGIDLSTPTESPKPVIDRDHLTIIAEIGSCHENNLDEAKRLLDAAKAAGADVAKAQFWSSGARLAARRNAPELREAYETFQIPRDWLALLRTYADSIGIEFACTSYLPEDVWAVAETCRIMKIASFEANDPDLLTCHREPYRDGRHIVISLGMGGRTEPIKECLLRANVQHGAYTDSVHFLHCVSAYPAPIAQLSLSKLRPGLFIDYGRPVYHGFSDHSAADVTITGAIAVGAGASILERHVRLDTTNTKNPDFPHSMTPLAFAEYVLLARLAHEAAGDAYASGPATCEEEMLKYRVTR